jgi:threonine aldolase
VTNQQRKSFGSDNHSGAHPLVLDAMVAANAGDVTSDGADPLTERVTRQLCDAFGAAGAFLVLGGTAANVLGLSLMLQPFEGVICAESAHVNDDECGAAERIVGSKLLAVPTADGKLTPDLIATRLAGRGKLRRTQPRAVVITQATEMGTCYSLDELRAIGEFCRAEDLLLYIDGARLANSAAFLGCTLAELSEYADVLSFGATKNGAVGTEALIVRKADLMAAAPYHRMQLLQAASKLRFMAAQFDALLTDELWLSNARQANAMAARLADSVSDVPGLRLAYPVQANSVFAILPREQADRLQEDWNFHVWAGLDDREIAVRWMVSFDTSASDVDEFAAAIRATAGAVSQPAR